MRWYRAILYAHESTLSRNECEIKNLISNEWMAGKLFFVIHREKRRDINCRITKFCKFCMLDKHENEHSPGPSPLICSLALSLSICLSSSSDSMPDSFQSIVNLSTIIRLFNLQKPLIYSLTHTLFHDTYIYFIRTEEFAFCSLPTAFNLCKFYLNWKLFEHWTVDKSTLSIWCGDNDNTHTAVIAKAALAAAVTVVFL